MRKKGVRGVDRAGKVNAAKSIFQGTYYAFDIHINRKTIKRIKVIYEEGQHNRILFQMVEVFQTNGYRLVGVDIEEVLRHISGFTSDQPIILQGPKVLPREESPPGYDYAANWMLGERKLIEYGDGERERQRERNDLVTHRKWKEGEGGRRFKIK